MKMNNKETINIRKNASLPLASPAWRTTDQAHNVPKSPNSFKKNSSPQFFGAPCYPPLLGLTSPPPQAELAEPPPLAAEAAD
jgi:hypothetical protein